MSNNNTYKRPVLVWGNSFYINISLERFNEGVYEDFDLTKATDLKVYLICATHNTEIPLDYEILQGFNNVLRCFVDYRLLHTTSYGIVVEGYDEQDMHFRFSMLPKEGFLVVNNTSGMSITEDVQVIDVSGRVGWGIQTDADLTNYYTKSEVDNLIAEIEVEIGDTYTKEEITQLLTLYPTKEEVNTKFVDYYTKVQTDNLLNQKVDASTLNSDYYNKNAVDNLLAAKADASDLNDYYDKTETDTMLDAKADASDLNDYQELLVSGQNIKTINNESILGSGNIEIQGGGATGFQQVQADWDEDDTTDPAYIQNKPDLSVYAETSDLATVATTGDYDDLTNKPDLSVYAETSDLATVATTGDYDDLSNKPTLFSGSYDDLTNKPDLSVYAETSDLSTVATTGDYDDLTNKPDLSVYAETSDLATVATTGDYTDLSNTPDLTGYATTTDLAAKQDTLVSGTNIKTINNESILGSGNIDIQGGGGEQVQADWDEDDTTDPAYIQNKPDLDDMQEVIGNALLDNDAKIDNVQYNIIPEIRQSLNQRIDDTNTALQNTQSTVNDQLDALDDQLYTAAQALNDLKESIPEGGVTSFNGATGAVTYTAPVTSVNGMTGAVTIQAGGDPIYYVYIDWQSTPQDSTWQGNQAIQFKSLEVWDLASNTRVYYKSFASNAPSVVFNEIFTQFGIRHTMYLDNMSGDISHLTFRSWNGYRWLDIPQTINNKIYGNGSILSFNFYILNSSFAVSSMCNKVVIPFMPALGRMVTSSTSNLKIEVVAALPASPDANTIYIVQ